MSCFEADVALVGKAGIVPAPVIVGSIDAAILGESITRRRAVTGLGVAVPVLF